MSNVAEIPEIEGSVEDYPDCIMVYPPHGFVRLVDWVGDELSVVNAARVSLHKASDYQVRSAHGDSGILTGADIGLLKFLLREKHGTPFEQGFMAQFHFRVPIFVMREWIRHRVGFSVNEESGRYVELRPDFFIPDEVRTQKGKPGAYTFERIEDRGVEEWFKGMLKYHTDKGFDFYRQALEYGVAKEQARLFLSLNLYTEVRWTCNARSLMNFLSLRNDIHAQEEIRTYAGAIEAIFAEKMPTVHQAFVDNERVAP